MTKTTHSLNKEIQELRNLVKSAFMEGFHNGVSEGAGHGTVGAWEKDWEDSDSIIELGPEPTIVDASASAKRISDLEEAIEGAISKIDDGSNQHARSILDGVLE